MAFDPVKNFAIVEVSTGYDDSATSIVLATGEAAKLPDPATDGAFNLVWFDAKNYGSPSEDPNREIIRVTGITDDTLTVTRAQESTTASTKNTAGGEYKMINAPTEKILNDLYNRTIGSLSGVTEGAINENDIYLGNASGSMVATPLGDIVFPIEFNEQTVASYTLQLSDAGKHIEMNNAAANTVAIPLNSSVSFEIGTEISIEKTGDGDVEIEKPEIDAEVLIVAGGGSGGGVDGSYGPDGGGGGAGEYTHEASKTLQAGSYSVVVGAGGAGVSGITDGNNGEDSSFNGIISKGGGGGGHGSSNGKDGGSGGGYGENGTTGGAAIPNQGLGNDGGAFDGGGAGSNGDSGGTGVANDISGSSVTYAAGGSRGSSTAGAANSGDGGGGGTDSGAAGSGKAGGSGVVIVRYLTAEASATGGTITTDGSYTVHTFTADDTFNLTISGADVLHPTSVSNIITEKNDVRTLLKKDTDEWLIKGN